MTPEQKKWADEYLAKHPHHMVIDKGSCLVILPKDRTVSEEWIRMRHEKDLLNYGVPDSQEEEGAL